MKIVVCIKQVPDTTDIKWTENNTIQREGVESVMNPYDVWALEAALSIKKQRRNVFITALTMGPNQAVSMLLATKSSPVQIRMRPAKLLQKQLLKSLRVLI